VVTTIIVTFGFITFFVGVTVYQAFSSADVEMLRLTKSGQPPDLTLKDGMAFHLFLSHIWSSGQDQVANIKRKLQLMLTGCQIFLDVDNLDDTGDLEQYVGVSQCILIFLSRGYFFSTNCLREVNCTIEKCKPLILVHEKDEDRGGVPLKTLREDCESKGREIREIFEGRYIITWHRVNEFQQLSLKLIAQQMLACTPLYSGQRAKLYLPNELSGHALELRRPVCLYVSQYNPGASALAKELTKSFKDKHLTCVYNPPHTWARKPSLRRGSKDAQALLTAMTGSFRKASLRKNSRDSQALAAAATRLSEVNLRPSISDNGEAETGGRRVSTLSALVSSALVGQGERRFSTLSPLGGASAMAKRHSISQSVRSVCFSSRDADPLQQDNSNVTHMLLYLNQLTFIGEAGQALAHEVRLSRSHGVEIILAHENDPDLRGCMFSRFFEASPNDLVQSDLYKKIAVALHPGPHRAVSLALLAKELGAVRRRRKAMEVALKAAESVRSGTDLATRSVNGALTEGSRMARRSIRELDPSVFAGIGDPGTQGGKIRIRNKSIRISDLDDEGLSTTTGGCMPRPRRLVHSRSGNFGSFSSFGSSSSFGSFCNSCGNFGSCSNLANVCRDSRYSKDSRRSDHPNEVSSRLEPSSKRISFQRTSSRISFARPQAPH